MQRLLSYGGILFLFLTQAFSLAAQKAGLKEQLKSDLKAEALFAFTENKGQIADQNNNPRPDVLFSGSTGDMVFHLRNNGVSYQVYRVDTWAEPNPIRPKELREPSSMSVYRLDITWLNANKNVITKSDNQLSSVYNYYLEQCPQGVTS